MYRSRTEVCLAPSPAEKNFSVRMSLLEFAKIRDGLPALLSIFIENSHYAASLYGYVASGLIWLISTTRLLARMPEFESARTCTSRSPRQCACGAIYWQLARRRSHLCMRHTSAWLSRGLRRPSVPKLWCPLLGVEHSAQPPVRLARDGMQELSDKQ